MGFDIYGLNPKEQTHKRPNLKLYKQDEDLWHEQYGAWEKQDGSYFRNNCWWWRPLADYIFNECDDFLSSDDQGEWHMNNGHQVSEALAIKIADRMDKLIDTGHAKKHEEMIDKKIMKAKHHNNKIKLEHDALKKKVISKYKLKDPAPKDYPEDENKEWDEIQSREDYDSSYPFEVSNVREFAKFCRDSGGFSID